MQDQIKFVIEMANQYCEDGSMAWSVEKAAKLLRARDAEIRRECAERAVIWLKTLHHEPEPGLPWSGKIKRMQELQIKTLIAAIIGEEE